MAHAHKSESKSARSSKLRSMGMGGGRGRSGRDDAAAFDGGATMSSADQAPAGAMPTTPSTDAATAGMYRRGGKVEGMSAMKRMDRVGRKSGGRVCKADGGQADLVKSDKASDTKKLVDRKAAEPLKGKKAQNFDMSDSPLFGDGPKQGSLFKRGGKVKDSYRDGDSKRDTDRDGRARGGGVNKRGTAGQDATGSIRSMKGMQAKVQTPGPSPKFAGGGRIKRAMGGQVGKGKGGSTVNVIIAPQGGMGGGAPGGPPGAGAPPPPPPVVPNQGPPPGPPPGAGAPPPNGGIAMGGAPGMAPPPGGKPFKRGGRVSSGNPLGDAGQHSGQGRINQAKFYARQGD